MSGSAAARVDADPVDRRKARTRQALVQAFVELMFERRYEDFGVVEIAARANVGRSTFYEHFAGKDALLRASMARLSGVLADAAAGIGEADRLQRLVAHFWEKRRLGRTVFAPPLRALVERELADMIDRRLGGGRQLAAAQIAAAQLAALEVWLSGGVAATVGQIADALASAGRLA